MCAQSLVGLYDFLISFVAAFSESLHSSWLLSIQERVNISHNYNLGVEFNHSCWSVHDELVS